MPSFFSLTVFVIEAWWKKIDRIMGVIHRGLQDKPGFGGKSKQTGAAFVFWNHLPLTENRLWLSDTPLQCLPRKPNGSSGILQETFNSYFPDWHRVGELIQLSLTILEKPDFPRPLQGSLVTCVRNQTNVTFLHPLWQRVSEQRKLFEQLYLYIYIYYNYWYYWL